MLGPIFFAWIDSAETFDPGTHAREDEDILTLTLSQAEGEFARAEIELADPGMGLNATSRKQWAFIAIEQDGVPVPLFKGRLTSWPLSRQGRAVRLEFIAEPADWQAVQAAWLDGFKAAPHWDPLFVPADRRNDPAEILAARAGLPFWDPVTLGVRLSDILEGSGLFDLGSDGALQDWRVRLAEPPIAGVEIAVAAEWEQAAIGEVDVGAASRAQFGAAPDGESVINTLTPTSFERGWDGARPPKGYDVKLRSLQATTAHGLTESDIWSPTVTVSAADYPRADGSTDGTRDARVPRVWYDGEMILEAEYEQKRREELTVSVSSAIQDLALVDQRSERMEFQLETPTDAEQGPAIPFTAPSHFTDGGALTARGRQAVEHALLRAVARLKKAARAVETVVQCDPDRVLGISCDASLRFADPDLPGGSVRGKVSEWRMRFDGDSGRRPAELTIASCIGSGAASATGAHHVAERAYANEHGAASMTSRLVYALDGTPSPNAPIDAEAMQSDESYLVLSASVTNGGTAQAAGFAGAAEPDAWLEANPTGAEVTLRSLNPEDRKLLAMTVTAQPLTLPRQVDLEAGA